ncbi:MULTISPECIES: hypothetical protein [Mycolicibacter]|uniref:Uncharacterized protein n=2 Tax=Mycolicibacter TaxID=1073531 RepID=A0ABU5XMB3_9MYCO|nr:MULTISPECIES: hypothetical protein [unclassified Mycolicibacter]MEB3023420.1 hypothetical protein [Mycolicibacter sp. MYC098]MEB3033762.1 hypothetical protein [Mycolicibacter sp. MYC340]
MSVDEGEGLKTWTVVGHWEGCEIVIENVVEGDYQDPRIDTGYWDEGLFAAPGQGRTMQEAIAAVRAEYEPQHG